MKTYFLYFKLMTVLITAATHAQDMFPVRQLTSGIERVGFPSWSPDSKSVLYQKSMFNDTLEQNGLWIISADAREMKMIFKGIAEHPKWSPDGKQIVFDADTGKNIKIISVAGGEARRFLPDSVMIGNGGLPCWSPDGSSIAFVEIKHLSLCTWNFRTGELASLFSESGKVPLPGGWWNDGKSILVALMDLKTRESIIMRVYTDGRDPEQIPCDHGGFYRYLALSPDGSLLVFAAAVEGYLGLFIMSSEGGKYLPLTISAGHNEAPVWSPDGRKIAFNSGRSGTGNVWIMDIDAEKVKKELLNIR